MKKFILYCFLVFAIAGCKKDPCNGITCYNGGTCINGDCSCAYGYRGLNCSQIIPDCELYHTGSLQVSNYEDDPYYIYINGAYVGTLANGYYTTYNGVPIGTCSFKSVQASGYYVYPTEYTSSPYITQCSTKGVTFGN